MSGSAAISTVRHRAAEPAKSVEDQLAVEEPLEIRVQDHSVAVTMRTRGDDEELAIGFLCTEGVLNDPEDVMDLDICSAGGASRGNIVNVTLRDPAAVDLEKLTRRVFTSSSCGLCGKSTIESVCSTHPPISNNAKIHPKLPTLLSLPERLIATQKTFQTTGGLHAAALFTCHGELVTTREDVGRHNAVDKVLGRMLLDRRDASQLGLLVSGRIAFEIVQKALIARIGLVAGISAPTSLAVDLAKRSGQPLVGFLRDNRCNVYAGEISA